jgi:hypothetical protein
MQTHWLGYRFAKDSAIYKQDHRATINEHPRVYRSVLTKRVPTDQSLMTRTPLPNCIAPDHRVTSVHHVDLFVWSLLESYNRQGKLSVCVTSIKWSLFVGSVECNKAHADIAWSWTLNMVDVIFISQSMSVFIKTYSCSL